MFNRDYLHGESNVHAVEEVGVKNGKDLNENTINKMDLNGLVFDGSLEIKTPSFPRKLTLFFSHISVTMSPYY